MSDEKARVRIAVAVSSDGEWCATGYDAPAEEVRADLEEYGTMHDMRYGARLGEVVVWLGWVEAELPVPPPPVAPGDFVVMGEVKGGKDE